MRISISVLVSDELRVDAGPVLERVLHHRLRMAATAAGLELLSDPLVEWGRNDDPWSVATFEWAAVCSARIAGPVITTAEVAALDDVQTVPAPVSVRMAAVPNGETW